MNTLLTMVVIAAPASPIPTIPPAKPGGNVDRFQAQNFARLVFSAAQQVRSQYVREVEEKALIEAAVRGLYEETGQTIPENVKNALARASTSTDLVDVLTDTRILLGNHPNLTGSRSLFAAINGFKHATDSITGLVSQRVSTYASVDQDFGVGLELDGVVGLRWTIYKTEYDIATGRFAPVGYFGPVPRPEAVPSPAVFPWRVKRVVPGSPAQKAGVKPGDVITHIGGTEIALDTADRIFSDFAIPRGMFDPQTGQPLQQSRNITFRRGNEKPYTVTLKSAAYQPESAFGVVRTADDKWDCMLDRERKIGYIRIGPIENGLDEKIASMMSDLTKQGCRGLILDLRWCPGGYVTPGTAIASMFLKDGSVIAKMWYRNESVSGRSGDTISLPGSGRYPDLPLVLLVGQETVGGGELIACALRDNDPDGKRCVVIGQRSVGRAAIQYTLPAGFSDVQIRLTTGTSLRPNGKPRQRLPESLPTDDWGVRPDPGLEVPVTLDKSIELRQQAELHALRPADSREALPFDDPATDPYRLAALKYLRQKLDAKK